MHALVTALILIAFLQTAAGQDSNSPRKLYDPFIICEGNTSEVEANWPEGVKTKDYRKAMDLCSAANGNARNAGCICFVSNGNLDCDPNLGDAYVRGAVLRGSSVTVRAWCTEHCRCATQDEASYDRMNLALDDVHQWVQDHIDDPNNPHSSGDDYDYDYDDFPASNQKSEGGSSGGETVPHQHVQNQCGSTKCTTNNDCSQAGACKCKTLGTTYQPGPGSVAYLAACMVSLGGKRDDALPCPCNSSYVSMACCNAEDGMVHEDKQYKLGVLRSME